MSNPTTNVKAGTGDPGGCAQSETVHVHAVINGTVVEEDWTAEKITFQRDGPALLVNLWRNGRRAVQISYADAPRIYRVIATEEQP